MVTFRLISENNNTLTYWYYPEGYESKRRGVILVDKDHEDIRIMELAEDDWIREISPEELNKLAKATDDMNAETGEAGFTRPADESVRFAFYGDQVINRILDSLAAGKAIDSGTVYWY